MSYKKLKIKYSKMAEKENQVIGNDMVNALNDALQEILKQRHIQLSYKIADESQNLTYQTSQEHTIYNNNYIKSVEDMDPIRYKIAHESQNSIYQTSQDNTIYNNNYIKSVEDMDPTCQPLNLVKTVHIDITNEKNNNKRPADEVLVQPILKNPKMMKEEPAYVESTKLQQQSNKRAADETLVQPILKNAKLLAKETDNKENKIGGVLPLSTNLQNMNMNSVNISFDSPKNQSLGLTTAKLCKSKIFGAKRIKITPAKKIAISNMNENIRKIIDKNTIVQNDEEMVVLGSNCTTIERRNLEQIDWQKSSSAVTRNILKYIFGIHVLATHNLSGKKSPAFMEMDMPEKGQLDPLIIADVVNFMDLTLNMTEKEVKMAVTSACADAGKKCKRRSTSVEKTEE